MDGKAWITGQNWIDQFIGNCARSGHHDLIRGLTDGNSAYKLINNPQETFDCDEQTIGENALWVDREYEAKGETYTMCR